MNFSDFSKYSKLDNGSEVDEEFLEWVRSIPTNRVKAVLAIRDIKLTKIAKKHNVTVSELSKIVLGKRRTLRLRKILAEELGVPFKDLFSN